MQISKTFFSRLVIGHVHSFTLFLEDIDLEESTPTHLLVKLINSSVCLFRSIVLHEGKSFARAIWECLKFARFDATVFSKSLEHLLLSDCLRYVADDYVSLRVAGIVTLTV